MYSSDQCFFDLGDRALDRFERISRLGDGSTDDDPIRAGLDRLSGRHDSLGILVVSRDNGEHWPDRRRVVGERQTETLAQNLELGRRGNEAPELSLTSKPGKTQCRRLGRTSEHGVHLGVEKACEHCDTEDLCVRELLLERLHCLNSCQAHDSEDFRLPEVEKRAVVRERIVNIDELEVSKYFETGIVHLSDDLVADKYKPILFLLYKK